MTCLSVKQVRFFQVTEIRSRFRVRTSLNKLVNLFNLFKALLPYIVPYALNAAKWPRCTIASMPPPCGDLLLYAIIINKKHCITSFGLFVFVR